MITIYHVPLVPVLILLQTMLNSRITTMSQMTFTLPDSWGHSEAICCGCYRGKLWGGREDRPPRLLRRSAGGASADGWPTDRKQPRKDPALYDQTSLLVNYHFCSWTFGGGGGTEFLKERQQRICGHWKSLEYINIEICPRHLHKMAQCLSVFNWSMRSAFKQSTFPGN